MKTILMHGPSISNPSETVEREVPENDVQAYRAVGYVEGGLPKIETETVEVFEGDSSGASKSLGKVTRPKKANRGSK
jgi:hypothetical protein